MKKIVLKLKSFTKWYIIRGIFFLILSFLALLTPSQDNTNIVIFALLLIVAIICFLEHALIKKS